MDFNGWFDLVTTVGLPGTLIAFSVYLLYTGKFWTNKSVQMIIQDRDAWKQAHGQVQAINAQLTENLRVSNENVKTLTEAYRRFAEIYGASTAHVLNSLPPLEGDN